MTCLTHHVSCWTLQVAPVRKPDPTKPGAKVDDYWEAAQHKLLKDPKKLLDDLLKYDKVSLYQRAFDRAKVSSYQMRCRHRCV